MRKAARIALVIGGGTLFAAAIATPGAQAERTPSRFPVTAQQQPRQQERPDRIAFFQASGMISVATAIARFPAAPETASLKRDAGHAETRLAALPAVKERAAWTTALDLDRPSETMDSGRMASGQTGTAAIRRTQDEQHRAPVIVEFKGIVINFN